MQKRSPSTRVAKYSITGDASWCIEKSWTPLQSWGFPFAFFLRLCYRSRPGRLAVDLHHIRRGEYISSESERGRLSARVNGRRSSAGREIIERDENGFCSSACPVTLDRFSCGCHIQRREKTERRQHPRTEKPRPIIQRDQWPLSWAIQLFAQLHLGERISLLSKVTFRRFSALLQCVTDRSVITIVSGRFFKDQQNLCDSFGSLTTKFRVASEKET